VPQGFGGSSSTSASPVWSAKSTLPFAFKFNNAAGTTIKFLQQVFNFEM